MDALIKLLSDPANAGGAAAVVAGIVVVFVQLKKLIRQDQGESTVDMTYQGILATITKQHEECLRRHQECESRANSLELRVQVLERRT